MPGNPTSLLHCGRRWH